MQAEARFQRNMIKLENKLNYLKKTLQSNFSPNQKEWIQNHLMTFNKLYETLQKNSSNSESLEKISEDLYHNVRKAKRRVLYWIKFKSRDIDTFRTLRKEKGETWIPIVDLIDPPPRIHEIQNTHLWDLSFPCMSYTNEELCQFTEMIFKEQNLLSEFNISSDKFGIVVKKICAEYNAPAYHNFSHGFNVFQMFYALVKKTELESALDKVEKFATLIAALGHDMNHRGYNNAYESKLKTKTALTYYDTAILENMHASFIIKILKDPDIEFFNSLPDVTKQTQFRDLIIAVILATDMSKHFKLLKKFSAGVQATMEYRKLKSSDQPVDKYLEDNAFIMDRPQDKRRILKNIIHACDIGNPCQKYENYIYWSTLVTQEFDYQAKKEEKRGIEVTQMFKYKDLPSFFNGQVFFSRNLVLPLWEQIAILFHGAAEAPQNLKMNLKRLEEDKIKANED